MAALRRIWPQLRPSPAATLTASTIPSQTGRVIIVTGSTAGIGLELAKALYEAGATVYMAARSPSKAATAITAINSAPSPHGGTIKFLQLDVADLSAIAPFVKAFLAVETRLDVLFNNAGVANVPATVRTPQGLEMHMGTNCVGPYLLTQLLAPILVATAARPDTAPNSVRVVWSSSMLVDVLAPPEGVPPAELDAPSADQNRNYAVSKAGNWFLAVRLAKQLGPKGVVSVTQNPGNLLTAIFDETPRIIVWLSLPVLFTAVDGANTALWAGLAPDVKVEDGGRYVVPWGKWHPNPRKDLLEAIKDEDEGGKGYAAQLESWCEEKTKEFR